MAFSQFDIGCCCAPGLPCTGGGIVTYRVFGCGKPLEGAIVVVDRLAPSAQSGVFSGITNASGCFQYDYNITGFIMGTYRPKFSHPSPHFAETTGLSHGLICNSIQTSCTSISLPPFGNGIQMNLSSGYYCCNAPPEWPYAQCPFPLKETLTVTTNFGSFNVTRGASFTGACALQLPIGGLWLGQGIMSTNGVKTWCCDCGGGFNSIKTLGGCDIPICVSLDCAQVGIQPVSRMIPTAPGSSWTDSCICPYAFSCPDGAPAPSGACLEGNSGCFGGGGQNASATYQGGTGPQSCNPFSFAGTIDLPSSSQGCGSLISLNFLVTE